MGPAAWVRERGSDVGPLLLLLLLLLLRWRRQRERRPRDEEGCRVVSWPPSCEGARFPGRAPVLCLDEAMISGGLVGSPSGAR